MFTYLLAFVLSAWPTHNAHRLHEMKMITLDILSTDASVDEALRLENIVALESGFERRAVGSHGELGAFQLQPWPETSKATRAEWAAHGAREALRRMRVQGMQGYCGCVRPCPRMVENRTWPARLYRMAFDPPAPLPPEGDELAGNP
jgi:hypothetical protein